MASRDVMHGRYVVSFYRKFDMSTPAIRAIPAIPEHPPSKLAGIARELSPITRSLAMLANACEGLPISPDQLTAALGSDKAELDSGRLSTEQLRAFAEAVVDRHDLEAGIRPKRWTQAALCQYCGPVYLLPMKRAAVVPNCPWCRNREAGFTQKKDGRLIEASPIQRPKKICCAPCKHWAADVIGNLTGIGACSRGGPISTDKPAYPNVKRWCSVFTHKAGLPSGL